MSLHEDYNNMSLQIPHIYVIINITAEINKCKAYVRAKIRSGGVSHSR